MKNALPQFYRPSKEEFATLWKDGFFVCDANVLLSSYRYSEPTRRELIGILQALADVVWLPHQAAWEYQKNRLTVIHERVRRYVAATQKLAETQRELLDEDSRRPLVPTKDAKIIRGAFKRLTKALEGYRQEYESLFEHDSLRDDIDSVFTGKVGAPLSSERMERIRAEGEKRYASEQPPGYKDSSKDGNDRFGDLVMWCQMIEEAKIRKKPVILISDDRKEDWWQRLGERTIGPRTELVAEMYAEACVRFHIYSSEQFVLHAQEHLNRPGNAEAIQEIQKVQADLAPSEETRNVSSQTVSELLQLVDRQKAQLERELRLVSAEQNVHESALAAEEFSEPSEMRDARIYALRQRLAELAARRHELENRLDNWARYLREQWK